MLNYLLKSPLEQFDVISIFNFILLFGLDTDYLFFLDFSFFNIFVPFIILILLFLSLFNFFYFFTLIPTTIFQRFLENSFKFILNLIKQQIGHIGYKYIGLIFTIFFFILILNLLSMLPFGIALTSHLIVILFLSLSICVGIYIEGNKVLGANFYQLFLPKSSLVMLPLLLLIEIFSYIIRMFSLAIRLVANIMAGHTLIYIISTFSIIILNINFFFIIIGIGLICTIMLLELGVACLQAYVFSILVLIYIRDIYVSSH